MEQFIYNYITVNEINNKKYIGTHCTYVVDDNYLGSGIAILSAIKKYGKYNFTRKILCKCSNLEEALKNEQKYILEYNTFYPKGYNISPTGGTVLNGKHSEITKRKISKKLIGIFPSEEAKLKMSLAKKGRKDLHKQTTETKNKISNSNFGKNNGMYGKHPIPWNKGLTKETDERVRKNYENRKK